MNRIKITKPINSLLQSSKTLRMRKAFTCLFALALLLFSSVVSFAQLNKVNPWAVEAAFLRNFTRYVSWPDTAFSNETTPWNICILGKDPFGNLLDNALQGRIERGRTFSTLRINTPMQAKQCQIVYISYEIGMNRRAALNQLQQLPILTVSNAPEFLNEGGIIRFDIDDFIEMNINLDQAQSASLEIQTKMLELSQEVIRKGIVHRMR